MKTAENGEQGVSTTKDTLPDRVWAERQGAKAFLTRPVPERLLLDTINQALSSQ